MRKCLIIAAIFLSGPAWAAPIEIECALCRDVYEHPADYANHAYNQVFGENPTLSFAEGDLVRVRAPNGHWAMVDLNYLLANTGVSLNLIFLTYSISLPTGKIEMVVQDPRNTMTRFQAFAHSPDLLVGDGTGPAAQAEPEDDVEEPEQKPQKANAHGPGQEIICCQPGAYYWYADQFIFNMRLGGE